MKYVIYKLSFTTGVHFGARTLESSEYTFHSDTLFSALCQEAVKAGEEVLQELVGAARGGKLLLSDALPYMKGEYFLPKPVLYVGSGDDETQGDSVIKKAYKKMKYIPVSQFPAYLKGKMALEKTHALQELGHSQMKVSAAIHDRADTVPYRIGTYSFSEGCGLYVLCGMEPEVEPLMMELMEALSCVGIGGRRSSGLGRFELFEDRNLPKALKKALMTQKSPRYMTLNLSLPRDEELSRALEGATYQMEKRSGFVSSSTYADTQLRKQDLTVFAAGSVFVNRYEGDVYDVSLYGNHPVYRYAKPLFIGI